MDIITLSRIIGESPDDKPILESTLEDWGQGRHPFTKHPVLGKHGPALAKQGYEESQQRLARNFGGNYYPAAVEQAYRLALRLEAPHKKELEQLAIGVVSKIWGVDPKMLKAQLTNQVDPPKTEEDEATDDMQQLSVDLDPWSQELDDKMVKEINKRITMNTMMQGGALHQMQSAHHIVDKELNKIDPRLLSLYSKFASGSLHMFWDMDLAQFIPMAVEGAGAIGSERIEFNKEMPTGPTVSAKATVFPVLCQELSKGVAEMLSMLHHYRNLDDNQRKAITKMADQPAHELWQFTVSPVLWKKFLDVVNPIIDQDKELDMSKIVATLASRDPDLVHEIINNVVENPAKARELFIDALEDVRQHGYHKQAEPPMENIMKPRMMPAPSTKPGPGIAPSPVRPGTAPGPVPGPSPSPTPGKFPSPYAVPGPMPQIMPRPKNVKKFAAALESALNDESILED